METKKKSLISQSLPFLKGYRFIFVLALIFTVFSSVVTVFGPDKLKEMTDVITQGLLTKIDMGKIREIGFHLALLYGAGAILGYSASFIIATMIQQFSKRMRAAIAEKINRVPLAYFNHHDDSSYQKNAG